MFGNVSVKLPFEFDVEKLNEDLVRSEAFHYETHPLQYHDGSWSAINLIYAGGKTAYTHEGELGYGTSDPEPTEVLEACPYFQEVLETLPGDILMARLSALPADGRILRHHDPVESVDFGQLRLHIPIRNNPREIVFHLGFQRQRWSPGETWYGDFTFPHSVYNKASYTRVNMIVDIAGIEPYRDFFPAGYFTEKTAARRQWLREETRSISWRLGQLQKWWAQKVAGGENPTG